MNYLTKMRQLSKGPTLMIQNGTCLFVVLAPRSSGSGADVLGAFTSQEKGDALVDYLTDQSNEHWSPGAYCEQVELNVDHLNVLQFLTFNED